jgi:glycosyltransferase involved in cell wall biosynthesis
VEIRNERPVKLVNRTNSARRIAFVTDCVYPFSTGGRERRTWEISRRLAANGHEVCVYTMKWWDGPDTIAMDGVLLHAISRRHELYQGAHRSTTQALLFGCAVLRLLTFRFDVLDVDQMPFFSLFSARLVCALRHKRLTATWHEVWGRDYWRSYAGRTGVVGYAVERLAAHMPHQIIANSKQTSQRLREVLYVRCPVFTVPSGIDLEAIDAAAPSQTTTDVLYAGRLMDHKGVDMLLQAMSLALRQRIQVRCTIIGDGPERAALERLARELCIAGDVRFTPFLPDNEFYGVMKSSKVFVLPSTREGLGLVVLEANACGLPVVTVRHPNNAARHLVNEGQNGFLANPDADDLLRAILLALSQRSAMNPRAALECTGSPYHWSVVADHAGRILLGEDSTAV